MTSSAARRRLAHALMRDAGSLPKLQHPVGHVCLATTEQYIDTAGTAGRSPDGTDRSQDTGAREPQAPDFDAREEE